MCGVFEGAFELAFKLGVDLGRAIEYAFDDYESDMFHACSFVADGAT